MPDPDSDKKPTDALLDKAAESFKLGNNLATLNKEDFILMTIFKITIRIVGIIVLIAISPFALVGLIIAIIAVI